MATAGIRRPGPGIYRSLIDVPFPQPQIFAANPASLQKDTALPFKSVSFW